MTENDKRPASGDRRPRKPGAGRPSGPGRPKSGAPKSGAPRSGAPKSGAPRSSTPRDGEGRNTPRTGAQRRDDATREGGRPRRDDDRENAPRHDDPPVDEEATPSELDRSAWRELKALTKENAEWVAGHLVMASRVVDEDPERAHKHALAASRRAGRIPVVRETVGITAYLLGDFALALRELRTYRRLSGSNEQVPMMVDCERGLGRPEKGLELAREVTRAELPADVQVELAIALSGCRLDLGQADRALLELDIPQRDPNKAFSYSPALFDAYAVVLSELGREEEAAEWGKRASIAAQALAEAGASDDLVVTDTEDPSVVIDDESAEENTEQDRTEEVS